MKSIALLTFIFSLGALAQDPNFITPEDLPKTTYQIYSESGHPPVPNFPDHFGEAEALKANLGEDDCHSKVGQQLTPWVREILNGTATGPFAQYSFSVSAKFECLPPTLSVVLPAAASDRLSKAIPTQALSSVKKVRVLCYDSLEEVCDGQRLLGYNEYKTCEIVRLDDLSVAVLIDENKENGTSVIRGARALEDLLPIYRDTRRDELQHPGVNCAPAVPEKLKGLERKAATITCEQKANAATSCKVEGIVRR